MPRYRTQQNAPTGAARATSVPRRGLRSLMPLACAAALLSACMAPPPPTASPSRAASILHDLPPMKVFAPRAARQTPRSNASIAQDFLDLTFALETGAQLDRFTRFEGPITLRVTGTRVPTSLTYDLGRLLTRFEKEAGIEIARVPPSQPASITIETVSQSALSRRAPNTACIVVPNISSWDAFRRARRAALSWTHVETRQKLSIFIPENVAPQEIRDCLHEELAQALGPLNDLFRLPDTVFNDDNIHSVLTPFDMLVLRATYDPALHSGMSRAEVAAALPAILDRIHPIGASGGRIPIRPTPPAWSDAVLTALGDGHLAARQRAAKAAVAIAVSEGWDDNRAGFSWFLLGRLAIANDRVQAHLALSESYRLYSAQRETRFHAARVALELSVLALSEHRYDAAYEISAGAIEAARDAENAWLLASLMMAEAEALSKLGRVSEAQSLRLDSLGWARYGFGSDEEVRARAAELTALAR